MATTNPHTAGLLPATNDLLAFLVLAGVYLTRIGVVAEGVTPGWWLAPLYLTTDLLLPLLAGLWVLGVPVWQVWTRCRE